MSKELYLLTAILISGFALLFWFINQKIKALQETTQEDKTLTEWLKSMQASLDATQKTLNDALQNTNKTVTSALQRSTQALNLRLDKAAQFIAQVAKEVGQMSELNQSLRDLQLFLQSPKLRGNIGEQVLKDLIAQAFPKGSFHLQYQFKSGAKVDAAIKTAAGILPIDSKFPMENFRRMTTADTKAERQAAKKEFIRDVKKHIADIAKKYILPEEGTLDFAFMYLPSETVFYEVANNPELLDYARQHRIYPVSPNTLYVHLQTVLLSFEGQKLEARSRQVFRMLRAIKKDYEKTQTVLNVLGKHIQNAYNQFANVLQNFSLLGQKLSATDVLSDSSSKTPPLPEPEG